MTARKPSTLWSFCTGAQSLDRSNRSDSNDMRQLAVTEPFTRDLPKAELHAHLSGSISVACLREIWRRKRDQGKCMDLDDPATTIRPGGQHHDVVSFFPLFDRYIYQLCDDVESIQYATASVLRDFKDDGVVHLELRTTPRDHAGSGLTKEMYVTAVQQAIHEYESRQSEFPSGCRMTTTLILSIDRRMTREQAMSVVELAIQHQHPERSNQAQRASSHRLRYVVGVDLCGNPAQGNVAVFADAFALAKAHGLGITLHFAEIPQSSRDEELQHLLAWEPDRLGHVIHVEPRFAQIIEDRKLGLELCLSCNVLAKMTTGGFPEHHFGRWRKTGCPIALSTDDVGIFDSPLSNEYRLTAMHFGLGAQDLIDVSRSAARAVFSGKERLLAIIDRFERECSSQIADSNSA